MRHDELMHYGVKGMRWKNRKAIIDPSNTDIRVKKADDSPRIEKEKNLVLSGKANKRFATSEKETDDKEKREELNSKIEQAEKEDREAREEAARLAYEAALAAARKRQKKKKEEPKEEPKEDRSKNFPKSSSIIFTNTTAKDYYKTANGKVRRK